MPDEMDENGPDVSDHVSENEDEPESYTQDDDDGKMGNPNSADGTTEVKRKYDPKDPLRPRRKKARRACFACQRAHLTCGKSEQPALFCQLGPASHAPVPSTSQALFQIEFQ
jgi:hypothetical protein